MLAFSGISIFIPDFIKEIKDEFFVKSPTNQSNILEIKRVLREVSYLFLLLSAKKISIEDCN
jgi:hypothetical protein